MKTYFIFLLVRTLKEKIWTNLQRIIELFTQNVVIKLSEICFGFRDPGPEKTNFGSRMQRVKKVSDPGSATMKKPYKITTPAGWGSTAIGCCGCPTCTGERAGPTFPRLSRPLWTLQQASSSKVGIEPGKFGYLKTYLFGPISY